MGKIFVFLFLFISAKWANAQEKSGDSIKYQIALRFNPFGLVDVADHNFSVGAEYCFRPQWSITLDGSYIFGSSNYQGDRTAGFIVKPAIRYYTYETREFYIETDVFYKHVGYRITDWLGKDCVNDIPTYEEHKEFTLRKQVAGINFKIGRVVNMSTRLKFEVYFGVGLRKKWFSIKDDPRACYDTDNWITTSTINATVLPSVPFGVRFLYFL